jgi:hypothetical protein
MGENISPCSVGHYSLDLFPGSFANGGDRLVYDKLSDRFDIPVEDSFTLSEGDGMSNLGVHVLKRF